MEVQAVAGKAPPEGVVVAGSKASSLPTALRTLILKIKFIVLAFVSCLSALLDHKSKENLKERLLSQLHFAQGLWGMGQKGELPWPQLCQLVRSADRVTRGQILDDLPGAAAQMDRILCEAEVRRKFSETLLPHDKLKCLSLPILQELLRFATRPGGVAATDPEVQLLGKLFEELPGSALEALIPERLQFVLENGADLELDQIPLAAWVRFETEDLEKLQKWLEQNKMTQPQQALLEQLVRSEQPLPAWSSIELLLKCVCSCQGPAALLSIEQLLKVPSWPLGLRDLTFEWLFRTTPIDRKEREFFQKMANLSETERQSKATHWECLLRCIPQVVERRYSELSSSFYHMERWIMGQSEVIAQVSLQNCSGWPALINTFSFDNHLEGIRPERLRLLLTHAQELVNWRNEYVPFSFWVRMEPAHLEMVLTHGSFFRNCLNMVSVNDPSADSHDRLVSSQTQSITLMVAVLVRCPDEETRRWIYEDNAEKLKQLSWRNSSRLTRLAALTPETLKLILQHQQLIYEWGMIYNISIDCLARLEPTKLAMVLIHYRPFFSKCLEKAGYGYDKTELMAQLVALLEHFSDAATRQMFDENGGQVLMELKKSCACTVPQLAEIAPEKLRLFLQHPNEVGRFSCSGISIFDLAGMELAALEIALTHQGVVLFKNGCSLGLLRFHTDTECWLREKGFFKYTQHCQALFLDLVQLSNEALRGLTPKRLEQLFIEENKAVYNREPLDLEWYESLLCKREPLHHDGSSYLELFSTGDLVPAIQTVRFWYPDDYQTRMANFQPKALQNLLNQIMPKRDYNFDEMLKSLQLVKKLLSLSADQCRGVTDEEIKNLFCVFAGYQNQDRLAMLIGEMGPLSGAKPVSLKRLAQLGSVIKRSLENACNCRNGKDQILATAERQCGAIRLLCKMKCDSFNWFDQLSYSWDWPQAQPIVLYTQNELIDWLDNWTWLHKEDDEDSRLLIQRLEKIAGETGRVVYPNGLKHELERQ